MAVKEQEGVLYGCANLTLRENLTPEEYAVVSAAEQTNKAPKIKLKIVEMWQGD